MIKNYPASRERIVAVDVLLSVFGSGKKLDRALEEIDGKDLHLNQVYNTVLGVARRHNMFTVYLKQKLEKMPPEKVLFILESALFELSYNSSSKPYAVVSDALKIAENSGLERYKGLINAVLRRFSDNLEQEKKNMEKNPPFPVWFMKELERVFPKDAESISRCFLEHSPLFLFVNTIKTSAEKVLSKLKEQSIEAEIVEYRDVKAIKSNDKKVLHTDEFNDGLYTIQDLSSQVAVNSLKVLSSMSVLDLCSAPGGKAIAAAIMASDNVKITAVDKSSSRLFRVYENIRRMKLSSINVVDADIMSHDFGGELFDRIILDPPCSALGVSGRHPDVVWNKSQKLLHTLALQQTDMLLKAMSLLKNDGRLVYSVCTFTEQETTGVINTVLRERSDFKVVDSYYTLPNSVGMDGLFVCVLEKK